MRRSSRNSALAVLLVRSVRRRFVNCAMILSLSHEYGPRLRRLITLLQPGAVASPPLDDALGDDVDDGASDVSRASSIRDAQELVRALGSLRGQADRSPAQRRRQRGGALQHESPPRFAMLRAALQRRTGPLQPLRFCTMLSCGTLLQLHTRAGSADCSSRTAGTGGGRMPCTVQSRDEAGAAAL